MYIVVNNADLWITVQSLGTYECMYKNGELWLFNGKMYYLSHFNLPYTEFSLLLEYLNVQPT